jgi:hypothetical protein
MCIYGVLQAMKKRRRLMMIAIVIKHKTTFVGGYFSGLGMGMLTDCQYPL